MSAEESTSTFTPEFPLFAARLIMEHAMLGHDVMLIHAAEGVVAAHCSMDVDICRANRLVQNGGHQLTDAEAYGPDGDAQLGWRVFWHTEPAFRARMKRSAP